MKAIAATGAEQIPCSREESPPQDSDSVLNLTRLTSNRNMVFNNCTAVFVVVERLPAGNILKHMSFDKNP